MYQLSAFRKWSGETAMLGVTGKYPETETTINLSPTSHHVSEKLNNCLIANPHSNLISQSSISSLDCGHELFLVTLCCTFKGFSPVTSFQFLIDAMYSLSWLRITMHKMARVDQKFDFYELCRNGLHAPVSPSAKDWQRSNQIRLLGAVIVLDSDFATNIRIITI